MRRWIRSDGRNALARHCNIDLVFLMSRMKSNSKLIGCADGGGQKMLPRRLTRLKCFDMCWSPIFN